MKATTARSITSAAQDAATTSPPPRPASLRNTLAADAVARYRLPACVGGGSAGSVHRHGDPSEQRPARGTGARGGYRGQGQSPPRHGDVGHVPAWTDGPTPHGYRSRGCRKKREMAAW